MNYEAQIKELSERIAKLEKAEQKRINKRKREIIFKIIKFILIIIIILTGYIYINNNFIKPYKEKIDYVDQKVDTVEKFINDKWNDLQKYNPFTN